MTNYIELNRWGIKNDGTEAINTTKGINNALVWASDNGYSWCKLPEGIYLISKDSQIEMVSDLTLDLFGCTLKKETNGLQNYTIINIYKQKNSTVVGGVIEGDKATHDYTTVTGTHEWGIGIRVTASRNAKVDSVEIKNTTGYGASVEGTYNHAYWVYLNELESGTFDVSGNQLNNTNWVRSNKYYLLSSSTIKSQGYFMLAGNGYGGYGTTVDGKTLDLAKEMITVYFYNDANAYLGKLTRRTYEPFYLTAFPSGATKFKLSFRYNFANIADSTMTLASHGFSQGVNIVNCYIHDCRTLGIVGGGQYINIENCEISNIGGAAPGFGIDIEDGYNLNQNITIRNNFFHDNKNGDIVTISSRNVLVEMNKFNGMVTFGASKGENYVSQYNEYNGTAGLGTTIAGGDGTFAVFRYDHFTGGNIQLSGNAIYEGCVFDNCEFMLQSESFLTNEFRKCRINYNKPDYGWVFTSRVGSVLFDGCKFNIQNVQYYFFRSEAYWATNDRTKNSVTLMDCEIQTTKPLGDAFEVNNVTLIGNTFIGLSDPGYQYFNFKANKVLIANNSIDSMNMVIDGTIGTSSTITIKNNIFTNKKTTLNYGPDRNEGFYLRKFETVYFENNQLTFPLANSLQLRFLTIFGEKLIKFTDNTVISPNTTSKVELNGAYRASGDTTPISPLVAILKDNYYSGKIIEVRQSQFTAQLQKEIVGDNMTLVTSEPTFGIYMLGETAKNSIPSAGGYFGWICVAAGVAISTSWLDNTIYPTGARIYSGTNVYEAQNNGRSTAIAPAFITGTNTSVEDKVGTVSWKANTSRSLGSLVVPTNANGFYYECTTSGVSGSIGPAWSTTEGATISDGTAVWTARRIIIWKRIDAKAVFKQFGVIQS